MRPLVCVVIALLLSMQLFALLLQPAAGSAQDKRSNPTIVPLSLDTDAPLLDAAQQAAQNSPAVADQNSQDVHVAASSGQRLLVGYLPASLLSERPRVLQDIDPDWHFDGLALPVVECVLLINEAGDVDRVLIADTSLSPMLAEDVRLRFLAARFSPGRLHGRAVKSALRIEVRLD